MRGKQRAAQIPLSHALESSLKNVARAAVLVNTQKGLSGTVYVCFFVVFFMPRLPKAALGHTAFRRDVTSIRMCVCHVHNQSNKCKILHSLH